MLILKSLPRQGCVHLRSQALNQDGVADAGRGASDDEIQTSGLCVTKPKIRVSCAILRKAAFSTLDVL
eukprot:5820550-Pleurochrysis_carterae.AAC.1